MRDTVLKTTVLCGSLLGFLTIAPVLAAPSPLREGATVAISELCFLPAAPDGPVWIEVVNCGERPVDLRAWCVSDASGAYCVVQGPCVLPPDGIALIMTGAAELQPANAITFPDSAHVVHLSATICGGTKNECALYAAPEPDAGALVDFVRWGRTRRSAAYLPSKNEEAAAAQGIWRVRTAVYVGLHQGAGDPAPIHTGGSIGRLSLTKHWLAYRRDWFIYRPEDTTPGAKNVWPSPIPYWPADGTCLLLEGQGTRVVSFFWEARTGQGEVFRFQLASSVDFGQLAVPEITTASDQVDVSIPAGTYWWRVKRGAPGARWSRVETFTIKRDEPR